MIADSSVLIVYARARRLEVLFGALGPVKITAEVERETIGAAEGRPDAAALADALRKGKMSVVSAGRGRIAAVSRRYPNLGRGEVSVIAAALQRGEGVVLFDERPARRAASLEGLTPVGSLGVLARAHRMGLLKSRADVASALRDLLEGGLWIAPDVVEAFWQGLGGRP